MYYMIVKSSSIYTNIQYYASSNENNGDSDGIVRTEDISKALVLEDSESIYRVLKSAREKSFCRMEVFSRIC